MPRKRASAPLVAWAVLCVCAFSAGVLRRADASVASSPFASSAVSADVGLGMEALLPGLVDMRGLQSEVCTQNLRDAINAALSEIIGSGELTEHLLPLWKEVPFIPVLKCTPSPTPGFSSLPWPLSSAMWKHEDDLLQQILTRGAVRVAVVGRPNVVGRRRPPSSEVNSLGVYAPHASIGFFPDYARAVWRRISLRYAVLVNVIFDRYDSAEDAQAAVVAGFADMTNLDFFLSHRGRGDSNPQHALYASCPAVGLPLTAVVRDDGERTLGELVQNMKKAFQEKVDAGEWTVVVSSEEFIHPVSVIFPRSAAIKVVPRKDEAFELLKSGKAKVVFVDGMEGQHLDLPEGLSFLQPLSLVLAAGTWIRRSQSVKCLNREHRVSLVHAADAAELED